MSYGTADPDPYQTVTDPQHWFKGTVSRDFLLQVFFMNHLPPSP
jgi:hypothetical protein